MISMSCGKIIYFFLFLSFLFSETIKNEQLIHIIKLKFMEIDLRLLFLLETTNVLVILSINNFLKDNKLLTL